MKLLQSQRSLDICNTVLGQYSTGCLLGTMVAKPETTFFRQCYNICKKETSGYFFDKMSGRFQAVFVVARWHSCQARDHCSEP